MKIIVKLFVLILLSSYSYAQNTFLSIGKAGIGTNNPDFNLDIVSELPYLKISSTIYSGNLNTFTIKGGIIFNQQYADKTAAILEAVPPDYHVPGILFATKTAWNTPGPGATDWYYRMFIHPNGNVGIGTITPDAKLAVNGTIHAQEVKVDMNNWPDYVFKKTYKLPPLIEVKRYIDQNSRLPEMPSEQQVAKEGIDLGNMNRLLTKKIEEMTLYLIEKDNQFNALKDEVLLLKKQQKENEIQKNQINKLKQQLDLITETLVKKN